MRANGRGAHRIARGGRGITVVAADSPVFSADGRRIAFISGVNQVVSVEWRDGHGRRVLYQAFGAFASELSWSVRGVLAF